ncbi:MAG: Unknown protein [uncultured Sulfurovum sp.]|uniref:Ribbon-helix-helix protein CopG domain-containing protein n=1 Tax=uncultured Sulfurovum sp. TaxID=269237 RepID=A0A6S6S7Y4_9BACT|nr:MAG: Unknown protein [uncultured Sulfurovum sp.]
MTVRKNFNFDEETANKIEQIAIEEGMSQTEMVKKSIEFFTKEKKKQKRLKALKALSGSVPVGSLVDVDVKQIRIEKAVRRAK